MRQRLLIITLIISSIGIIIGCQKEIKNDDKNTLEKVQTKSFNPQDMKATALQYRAMAEKSLEQLTARTQLEKQAIENLISERRESFGNSSIMEKGKQGKSVIRIPADYPTLQEAVDNVLQNGRILVKGTVSDIGNVLVNKPGLTIEGEGFFPRINGNKLIITAANVTVQNLIIKMAIEISGTSNTTLMNNNISAYNSTGVICPVLSINSHHNTIKNCNVNGAFTGGSYEFGIYFDNLSNNNEVTNCISENTSGSDVSSAFRIDGANNRIKNCLALNFTRGFSSFGSNSKNNQFIGCIANGSNNDAGFVFILPDASNLKLEDCIANNNKTAGFFIYGGSCKVSNCTANSNDSYGIEVLFDNFIIEKSTFKKNNDVGIVLYDLESGLHKGTLEKNEAVSNTHFGIYMWGMNNSAITKNISKKNSTCDFNQKVCSGNTLTGNQFGTSCTGL